VQIGKILNVKHMLVGSLSKLMDTYYITVNVVDVETSKIVASYDQDAMSAKELKTACKILAKKLVNPQSN
jgi:TolB-like protein